MSRPPKPYAVLMAEKKSHRTKEELDQRKQGESALITGKVMRERPEVKANPVAHKEFQRLNALLKKIQKNDAIYESVINRYCLLYAECLDFEKKREACFATLQEMSEDKRQLIDSGEMTLSVYYKTMGDLQNTLLSLDRQVQAKRKMLLDVEKENIMTIAAAVRSVPKKVEKDSSPLLEAIREYSGKQSV